jgi:Family of unknown function (DUF6567)
MKLRLFAAIMLVGVVLAGCSTGAGEYAAGSGTTVDLSQKNYRVIKANAVGESSGFHLLGIIPFSSPTYTEAMTNLYIDSGVTSGGATAVANVSKDSKTTYLVLFSIPKLTVRADIIEFTK